MLKKVITSLAILFIVALAIIYFASGVFFDAAAKRVLPRVLPRLAERGIHVIDYDYESIKITSPRTVTAKNVRAALSLNRGGGEQKYKARFFAERVNFHIADMAPPAATLSCANFQFLVEKDTEIPGTAFGRFDHGYIRLRDPITLSDPRSGLHNILQNISALFREEDASLNAVIRALVTFKVRDKEAQAYLYTVRENGVASLRFEEKDIRKMADIFNLELSDDEVGIIANYPLRAPIIMRITSDAKETSRNAHKRDRSVPEDAYRHVLWSYLLTQKFGEAFAETVTDAHEVLPTNTAEERKMDFHNNRIGREYAQRGVKRERILWLVKNDENVIKKPGDVRRFYSPL